MSDPVRNIFIDNRMESYEGYVPDDWSAKAFGSAKHGSALDNPGGSASSVADDRVHRLDAFHGD